MKFAHLADCHLGSWRQPELQKLNIESFKKAIDICIQEKVNFVLIAGDLFDSAYPSIETLEEAFSEIKRLKDSGISCYLIAGSHDFSASGKTFLSVLEKSGFCKNIYNSELRNEEIFLNPSIHENVALYGYPGKKTGLEIQELRKVRLQESPGFFKVLALHTCIEGAIGTLPIDSLKESELPKADYYALGHLHIDYNKDRYVYAGPIFPSNFQELEELKHGSFYLVNTSPLDIKKVVVKLKDVEILDLEITNSLIGTDTIITELKKRDIKDKIVLMRISGKLKQGKVSDINFKDIDSIAKDKGAYVLLKSVSKLATEEEEISIEVEDIDKLEEEIITKYTRQNKSDFDKLILPLMNAFSLEKHEDETTQTFNSRLFSEISKISEGIFAVPQNS
ncbi:exonuclease SbcCD subunit D [Candidatus Pacearchaeota archaeon]|nr:exonuclease SbcCD subunit D [Candidatus Pacearchaeota archaeon]